MFELHPEAAEPSLRWIVEKKRKPELLLLPALLVIALVVASTALTGDFYMEGTIHAICQDIANTLNAEKLQCSDPPNANATMPLSRDLGSIVLLIACALTPYLIARQWDGFRDVFTNFSTYGLIGNKSPHLDFQNSVKSEVDSMNEYFCNRGSAVFWPIVFSVSTMTMVHGATMDQIYGSYSPIGVQDHGSRLARTWWANPNNSLSSLLFFLIGTMAIYYIVRMNIVGSRVVLGIIRLNRYVTYSVDIDNSDGDYGWRPAIAIMSATWSALVLHGAGLVALLYLVDLPNWIFAIPLLGQWVIVLPIYLILPAFVVISSVRRFRAGLENQLVSDLAATPQGDIPLRNALSQRLSNVRSLPALLPFKKWWTIRGLAISMIASAASAWAAINALWGINI